MAGRGADLWRQQPAAGRRAGPDPGGARGGDRRGRGTVHDGLHHRGQYGGEAGVRGAGLRTGSGGNRLWGGGMTTSQSPWEPIEPFRIDAPQADLDDLSARLAATRWQG